MVRSTEHGCHVEDHLRERGCHWTTLLGLCSAIDSVYHICMTPWNWGELLNMALYCIWRAVNHVDCNFSCITACDTYEIADYSRVLSIEKRQTYQYCKLPWQLESIYVGVCRLSCPPSLPSFKEFQLPHVSCLLMLFPTDRSAGDNSVLQKYFSHETYCWTFRDVTAGLAPNMTTPISVSGEYLYSPQSCMKSNLWLQQ